MKVKLLVSRAGINFSQTAGDVVEVDEAEGMRLIQSGQALAEAKPKIEKATKKPVTEKRAK